MQFTRAEVSPITVVGSRTLSTSVFLRAQRSCLLITLHYIDQICSRIPSFTLSSLTCHRFVITSIAVASKALCDAFCTNNLYARVGGIPVGELNMLEREFLRMIDWRLTVTLSAIAPSGL